MKKLLFPLLCVILVACATGPSEADIQAAIEQTQLAQSTATPEPMPTKTSTPTTTPLSELDLVPLLIQEGDLPAGITGAQIRDEAPGMFSEFPEYINVVYRQFEKDADIAGGVSVFLFESIEDLNKGFSIVADGMGDPIETEEVGENAEYTTIVLFGSSETYTDIVFHRCQALVHIRMQDRPDGTFAYAKKLDSRLESLVCK